MNSVQTVTLNSALSQNWVGYTVCTPKAQVAHTLRAQCPCRGCCYAHSKLVASMSGAQRAQVARIAPRSWAHVATSFLCPYPGQVVTSFPGRDLLEANPCRDIKLVSRHRSGNSRSRPPNGVATPFLCPAPKPGRDIKTRSRPSWRLTYVATSISCRDIASATVRFPGHDAKSQVATSHTTTHVATSYPCRNAVSAQPKQTRSRLHFLVATSRPISTKPGRDLRSMSRPQNSPMTSFFFFFFQILQ